MPIPSPLLRLYRSRLDWAIAGYDNFVDGIDPSVRVHLSSSVGASSAVLYGATQVGKTTLMLRLLGIPNGRISEVSTILRGGRSQGTSSTISACTYEIVDGDRWEITESDGRLFRIDSAGALNWFKSFRAEVTWGHRNLAGAMKVGIPSEVAQPADESAVLSTIYDLPGTAARNRHEQRQVEALAPIFVYNADLVLLVGQADGLGFARPMNLNLEPLRDWIVAPDRFRLILTHAYKPGTVQHVMRENPEFDLEAARRHYIHQMRTHDYPAEVEQLIDKIYPLDFGHSLASLEREPALYKIAQGINDHALKLLKADIEASVSIEQRLRLASRGYDIAKRVRVKRLREYDGDLELARLRVTSLRARVSASTAALAQSQANHRRARRYSAQIAKISTAAGQLSVQPVKPGPLEGRDREVIRAVVHKTRDSLSADAKQVWTDFVASVDKVLPGTSGRLRYADINIEDHLRHAFRPLHDLVDEQEGFWFWRKDCHSNAMCWSELQRVAKRSPGIVNSLLRSQARELLKRVKSRAALGLKSSGTELAQAEATVEARALKLSTDQHRVEDLKSARHKYDVFAVDIVDH